MLTWLWLEGLVRRRTARLIGVALCVALAVALVASLGAFITRSNAEMTARSIAGVPVDWQVQLDPGTNVSAARGVIAATPSVRVVRETGYGDVAAFNATTGPTTQVTGAGKLLGLPADYAATFPGEVRYLSGARKGVLIAQQTAANLHVAGGDTISAKLPDGRVVPLHIDGVIDLPQEDSLFQIVGAPPGSGATAPPDNVVLVPLETWRSLYAPVRQSHPEAAHTQFHLKFVEDLPPAPADAFAEIVARAHNLEARLAGTASVGNNLAAMLDAARADAVYSELLFLFLGLPGFVLACLLALISGASGHERRRREQALLRVRGASPGRITGMAIAESTVVGVLGVALGLGCGTVASGAAFGQAFSATSTPMSLEWAVIAGVVGLALAALSIAVPAERDARLLTVHAARAHMSSAKPPMWQRLYLDVLLLAASGLIFWQSTKDAYQVVLVPEGVPTISINYLTLLAPMTFWIGFALLSWRATEFVLRKARRGVAGSLRPLAGKLSGVVSASMSRQHRLISRSLVLVALAISFAFSVAIFNTTYMSQARVDAELTNGADVAVVAGAVGLPTDLVTRVRALPGVIAAEQMQHRLGYVGNDLQDLYGIDPNAIGRATPMSDAFFQDGTAAELLGKLAATPNGILVSDETVSDFQLQPGDAVRIRLQGADHAYHVVEFRYIGIAREFPTAPHDSFLIANAAYVAKATGVPNFETLLIRTSDSPSQVAPRVRGLLGASSAATVHDLDTEIRTTLSGLTAIDLTGLTRLELVFAVIMAVASSGLVLALGFAERRRSFAILSALGARGRQIASFVWAEALFAAVGGAVLGAIGGSVEALIVVKILTGVFDPPPETLSVPWPYLAGVLVAMGTSVGLAAAVAVRAARHPALEIIRDL